MKIYLGSDTDLLELKLRRHRKLLNWNDPYVTEMRSKKARHAANCRWKYFRQYMEEVNKECTKDQTQVRLKQSIPL